MSSSDGIEHAPPLMICGKFLISLLLFSACSHVYPSTINLPHTTQEDLPWQENTKKISSIDDALKRCICWPDNLPLTVQQLLDPQNNGQERLVIYLYKNDVTNEIKMYTPNANKQMLIPDIPYEPGDGLVTITTENVFSLLYNNPNKIKVFNDHIEKIIPAVTESLAIGLNTGAIESFYPNADSYLIPNNTEGYEYSYAKPIIANVQTADIVNEPLIAIPESYDTNNSNHTPELYWTANNYPSANPNLQAIPLDPQTTSDNNQTIEEDFLATPANLQFYPYKLTVNPISSESVLPNLLVIPANSQDHTVNTQIIPDSIKVVPGSYVGSLDQNNVYTFQTGQEKNILQPGLQDINNPLADQNVLTFNIWFDQQMQRFQNVHLPSDIKTIDGDSLKQLVQKTFLENNIYISTDGEITDAKGIVIDASNLELRPLLLGEKVNHQILRNTKVIKLPKHLPYLEGILVTLVSPPQILGIIPLGKTYLPETSYSTQSFGGLTSLNRSKIYINGIGNSNVAVASYITSGKGPYTSAYKDIYARPTKYYAYSEANGVPVAGNANLDTYLKVLPVINAYGNKKHQLSEHTYWSSGPYYTASKLPHPTANGNPSELGRQWGQRRKNPDAVIQHHFEQPLKTRKKGKGYKQLTTSDNLKGSVSEEVTTPESFLKINTTESGERYPGTSLSSMMQTLLELLNDLPSRRGTNSTGGADIVNESESNNDGGSPGFRIIGGNPATGSGTPLSNKGRSGVEYA